jgi:Mrp family chromosome partitioning ATPase
VHIVADEGGTRERPRPGIDPRDLRVSDAEREHVASLLHRALERGLLDLAEFSTRVDAAMAARTRGELNAVLVDLPGVVVRVDRHG